MNEIRLSSGQMYTVSKIIGVGRNYAEHAAEMNAKPTRDPVLFMKPATALCDINCPVRIPRDFGSVHYELELAVCIGRETKNLPAQEALQQVAGYGLALDLTLRDMQKQAKDGGLPWTIAKGFDLSCPVSQFVPAAEIDNVHNLDLWLKLNAELKQNANTGHMLFTIDQLISYISKFFTLLPGDLILTGTPAGVGALRAGDRIEASIDKVARVKTEVI